MTHLLPRGARRSAICSARSRSGIVFTRLAGTQDIRAIGSGNIGATNVLRTGRKGLAAATLLADMLKGTVAVLVMAYWWGGAITRCSPASARSSATCFRSG